VEPQKLPETGREIRALIRSGQWTKPTAGLASGHVQANLVILPENLAADFKRFCLGNPKPCPLIEVLEAGKVEPVRTAPGADIRTDIPKYCIFRDGVLEEEMADIKPVYLDNLTAFLLGCSFTFERALIDGNIDVPHFHSGKNVAMFRTNLKTEPAGIFKGPMVVSMRWIQPEKVDLAVKITAKFALAHGAPVHIGAPDRIGISDIFRPDYGDPSRPQNPDDVPVFWACGVTPQSVALASRPPLMITHSPGHMFITDLMDRDVEA
jgi:uncharacterized protein YcsI (UPF0317 family)